MFGMICILWYSKLKGDTVYMKTKEERINSQLNRLKEELNRLLERTDGNVTKEVVEMSQKLDVVIVQAIRNTTRSKYKTL